MITVFGILSGGIIYADDGKYYITNGYTKFPFEGYFLLLQDFNKWIIVKSRFTKYV